MTFQLEQGSRFANGTTVSKIEIERLGIYPRVTLTYAETAPLILGSFLVSGTEDRTLDGTPDALAVENLPEGVHPGARVERADRSEVGVVVRVEGSVLVMDRPVEAVPDRVWLNLSNVFGSRAVDTVEGSRRHRIVLDTRNPAHEVLLKNLMGRVLVDEGGALMEELVKNGGDRLLSAVTTAEVQEAIGTLAQKGRHVDYYLAVHAETPEKDRRAGTLDIEKVPV